ncbi:WG repeat-containing protein [Chondrinema litorale]|uniref:WG repeat-containing protein n=1 Tax=Chondrinema litorale TaxID=2994555 RepID=UPI002543DF12|nr:WG repeat-containing protein [Chondrinema litorale]UZR95988.1 WG repeat-containing protein [Chondrinema litorale]
MNHKVFKKYCFLITWLLSASLGLAQNVKPIQNALDKKDFEKAESKILKNLKKDSLDAGSYYLYSIYYVHPRNFENYHLDSAYKYVLASLNAYEKSDGKTKYNLAEDGIRLEEIQFQKKFIDSTAYNIADSLGSLEAYQYFLDHYQSEPYSGIAESKRDSIAFDVAQTKNTYEAYYDFIRNYPEADEYKEAKKRYDDLLYKVKTEKDDIFSLQNFIESYPESPYWDNAQLRLFNLYTLDNSIEVYEKFIEEYSQNIYVERAWSWIWYLQSNKDEFLKIYPQFPDKSFVENALKADTLTYYPFYDDANELYGFMSRFGNELIPAGFERVPEQYLCEGVNDDFIVTYKNKKAGVVNILGQQITEFEFQEISNFDKGVLLVKKNNRVGLYHKSGFEIIKPEFVGMKSLPNRLVKYTNGAGWGLISYSGKVLTQPLYDNIEAIGEQFLVFEKDDKYSVTSKSKLFNNEIDLSFDYTDFELLDGYFLLLEKNNSYALFDLRESKLLFENVDDVFETKNGWVVEKQKKFQVFNKGGIATSPLLFDDIIMNQRSFGVKIEDKWGVSDDSGNLLLEPVYDTLYFVSNKGILLYQADKKFGYFYKDNLADLSKYTSLNIQLVTVTDTSGVKKEKAFIITKNRYKQAGLIDDEGKVIIANKYSEINVISEDLFIVEKYSKKGVVNAKGKQVVTSRYEGIVIKDDYFALLNNKKFGLYDPRTENAIGANYDMMLNKYGNQDDVLIAKNGKYGLINLENDILVDFQFEDLRYWTDSVALVKHQGKWKLYHIKDFYFVPEVFDTFEYVKNSDEIIIITYRSSGFGVLSSKYGRIIPEEYSAIVNMGSDERPFYFVERDVAQAGLYIVLYIDEKGKVNKKQVLKEQDYFKIACPDDL